MAVLTAHEQMLPILNDHEGRERSNRDPSLQTLKVKPGARRHDTCLSSALPFIPTDAHTTLGEKSLQK